MPPMVHLASPLRLLPVPVFDLIASVLGVHDSMDDFVGRAEMLAQILGQERAIISGLGGVGKTALGLVAGHYLFDRAPESGDGDPGIAFTAAAGCAHALPPLSVNVIGCHREVPLPDRDHNFPRAHLILPHSGHEKILAWMR